MSELKKNLNNESELYKNVLFIWLPKVAGTSIFKVLEKYGCQKLKRKCLYENFENKGWVTFSHVSVLKLLKRKYVDKKFFDSAFKFAFVRNPWDRMVSLYHYRGYDNIMSFEDFVYLIKLKQKRQKMLLGKLFTKFLYVSPIVSKVTAKVLCRYKKIAWPLPEVGLYNVLELSQANPQSKWLYDEKRNLIVDFLGYYENLDKDIETCFQKMGLNEKLDIYNTSVHKDYKLYYTDETINLVADIYKEDIENFGYEF